MLEKEFKFYVNNLDELLKKYNNKFIVIIEEEVVGSYDSHLEAYTNAIKEHKLGTFLIQHCIPGTESFTQTFHSQVVLSK